MNRNTKLLIVLLLAPALNASAADRAADYLLQCDRNARKLNESLQAWRRTHLGAYPERLADLANVGAASFPDAVCPGLRYEARASDGRHPLATSRGEGADPGGFYEYELTPKDLRTEVYSSYIPVGTPSYTRRDIKLELLRRSHADQVPILRCSSHGSADPRELQNGEKAFRNATFAGTVYWSGSDWEDQWLSDVPYCERFMLVLMGLKGPPFYVDKAPQLSSALDLRGWSCAFGDRPWWWPLPLFVPTPNFEYAADLRAFFAEKHARVLRVGSHDYWLNGLTQLQGKISSNLNADLYRQSVRQSFVWERTGLPVGRKFRSASWLQGTLWTAPVNETAGWLVWHYSNGLAERVPITYGRTNARFWGDLAQIAAETNFPTPAWKHHESAAEVGKERWLRLYEQTWENPHPETAVTTLEFVSNRDSPAGPFVVSINVYP